MAAKTRWTSLNWQDPFELDSQLSEEQRMVRDSAQQYAQNALAPRRQGSDVTCYIDGTTLVSNRPLRSPYRSRHQTARNR